MRRRSATKVSEDFEPQPAEERVAPGSSQRVRPSHAGLRIFVTATLRNLSLSNLRRRNACVAHPRAHRHTRNARGPIDAAMSDAHGASFLRSPLVRSKQGWPHPRDGALTGVANGPPSAREHKLSDGMSHGNPGGRFLRKATVAFCERLTRRQRCHAALRLLRRGTWKPEALFSALWYDRHYLSKSRPAARPAAGPEMLRGRRVSWHVEGGTAGSEESDVTARRTATEDR